MDFQKFCILVFIALFIWGLKALLADTFRFYGMKLFQPIVENPYGKDYERNFPRKVRFLRLPVRARIGQLKGVFGEIQLVSVNGENFDCPGLLHWQRQPRSGKPHQLTLHQALKNEDDVKSHMYDYHFSNNEPIDIQHGEEDKIDLLMKIENIKYAITTVSRENHIPPGEYEIDVKVSASNISRPKRKRFNLVLGEGIADFEVGA